MNLENAIRRSQIYGFLSEAFLYPTNNWLESLTTLKPILNDLPEASSSLKDYPVEIQNKSKDMGLSELQAHHRQTFGATGSLCYETEYGLPSEFRQSQELADLAGFYRAFGFQVGGMVRERPDHIAVELEFMHILVLKEALAIEKRVRKHIDVCVDAQRKFIEAHLGSWVGLLSEATALNDQKGVYLTLTHLAKDFVYFDAQRLGISLVPRHITQIQPTPLGPDLSCDSCAVTDC